MQAKSKTKQCQCAFKYHERECYNQFSVGVCQRIHICVHIYMFLYVYVFPKGCTFVSLSVCAGVEWGSVVCLCVEGPGCSPDFSRELQWSMSSAEKSKNKPPDQELNGQLSRSRAEWPYPEDNQPSPWPAAG